RAELIGEVADVFDDGVVRYSRMTNMKRTLLHSLPAYHALMTWYPLFDTIKAFIGERAAIIFAHAISAESDCLICTTFMRRVLINWGEDPSSLALDERGEALVDFGRAIARQGNRIPSDLYLKLENWFTAEQIVALTGFASLMIATNVVNNALEIDLDEYLYAFKAPESGGVHAQ
ncbi:MAG TPA: hypothetical protein PK954_06750, partial [Anaerolineales bacterium]|nr:hypothetical protein [Anaerolineales bacterium]